MKYNFAPNHRGEKVMLNWTFHVFGVCAFAFVVAAVGPAAAQLSLSPPDISIQSPPKPMPPVQSTPRAQAPTLAANSGGAKGTYEDQLHSLAGKLVAQLEAAGQKSGTVIDFTDLQGQGTELGRFLAQELSDQLVSAAKTISFIDRVNLQHLLKENKLSMEGLVNPESSRKLGNMIGIDAVIFGNVTPIGRSVRLSTRAVALETGKIVASQSITIPAAAELSDLYTRGIADVSPNSNLAPTATPKPPSDVRNRIRADSFKLVVSELAVQKNTWGTHNENAKMAFSVQNLSGIGVGLAVRKQGYSAGPCTDNQSRPLYYEPVNGLAAVASSEIGQLSKEEGAARRLTWFPPGAKQSGTISFFVDDCNLSHVVGLKAVSTTINLVLAVDKDVIVLPLTVENTPIRVMGKSALEQVRVD
jgi:hypothetical protein